MIIPAAAGKNQPLFAQIRNWGKQWKNWAPATRDLVEMAIDPGAFSTPLQSSDFADFVQTLTTAATKAHGGTVGLHVGHGGATLGIKSVAWVNLVPEDRKVIGDPNQHFRLMIDETRLNAGAMPNSLFTNPNDKPLLQALDRARGIRTVVHGEVLTGALERSSGWMNRQ